MEVSKILNFLTSIRENNNRVWFSEHKDFYLDARKEFENIVIQILENMPFYDENLKNLNTKECIFRFYRDIRFSLDKSPYKRHFGAYICQNGGRKSKYAGYYLHIEPNNIMLVGGLWSPEMPILKKVRQAIVDNYEELKSIMQKDSFKKYFNGMESYEKYTRLPNGFDKNFEGAEYLKYKHFLIEHKIADKDVDNINFADYVIECFKAMIEFNSFINYTIDE